MNGVQNIFFHCIIVRPSLLVSIQIVEQLTQFINEWIKCCCFFRVRFIDFVTKGDDFFKYNVCKCNAFIDMKFSTRMKTISFAWNSRVSSSVCVCVSVWSVSVSVCASSMNCEYRANDAEMCLLCFSILSLVLIEPDDELKCIWTDIETMNGWYFLDLIKKEHSLESSTVTWTVSEICG